MGKVSQNQTQIQYMEKVRTDIGEGIVNEVLDKLKFAITPEVHELKVLPSHFMTIPGLQRFASARYKFEKYEGKDFIMFVDKEFAVRYFNDSVEIFLVSRTSGKIYHKRFYYNYELPKALIPTYKDLTTEGAKFTPWEYTEDIIKKFFALNIELDNQNVYRQGHLYALKIIYIENLETWVRTDDIFEIGNHKWEGVPARSLTNDIYYINTESDLSVESQDHGVALLPRGEWILYHPFD